MGVSQFAARAWARSLNPRPVYFLCKADTESRMPAAVEPQNFSYGVISQTTAQPPPQANPVPPA